MKTIKTDYGNLGLVVCEYANNSRLSIFLTKNGEYFSDLTINLPDAFVRDGEAFIDGDLNDGCKEIIDALKNEEIIICSYGFRNYNMGSYEYVLFDLDKLREYDKNGVDEYLKIDSGIDKENNNTIRELLGKTYFMDQVERMTYRLLLHYAFVLNEDVTSISDEEIDKARSFSKSYFETNDTLPEDLDFEAETFVNRERFNAISGLEYETIKDELQQSLNEFVDSDNIYYVYYNEDSDKDLYIKQLSDDTYYNYDIKSKNITICDNDMSDMDIIDTFDLQKNIKI